jgi:ketosteroid isomerase-like protein
MRSYVCQRAIVRVSLAAMVFMPLVPYTATSDASLANAQAIDHELRNVEAQLSAALSRPDVDLLSSLWADDFVSTMADGHVVSRERRLASLSGKAPDGGGEVTSTNDRIDVRAYGDWAVVLVTSSWHVDGKLVGDSYQATHVWAKRKGAWRLIAAHISSIKP